MINCRMREISSTSPWSSHRLNARLTSGRAGRQFRFEIQIGMSFICDTNLKFHSENAGVFFQSGQSNVFGMVFYS